MIWPMYKAHPNIHPHDLIKQVLMYIAIKLENNKKLKSTALLTQSLSLIF